MRIGLLGGSFDPIHNAHLQLAEAALEQLELDRVYLVLSPKSPFKSHHNQTPVNLRLQMLRLALKGKKKIRPGLWELNRKGPSYTVLMLRDYKRKHPNDEIYFVMGSDTYRGFDRWKNPRMIRAMSTLVVGRRPGAKCFLSKDVKSLRGIFPHISSTQLRGDFAQGQPLKGLLPDSVRKFILKKGLYSHGEFF